MIEITSKTTDFPSLTPKMIAQEALSRGWRVQQLYHGSSIYTLTRSDNKVLTIYGATPPTTGFVSHHIAQDKFACFSIMQEFNIPQPLTYLCDSLDLAIDSGNSILNLNKKVVVKPLDKAHGMGVTTNITNTEQLLTASERAFKLSKKVLVQEHVSGDVDLRIVVIDGQVRAALQRIPAGVMGDGKSTIRELVTAENSSNNRGDGYTKPLSKIKLSAVKAYLGDRQDLVPSKNEKIQVVGVANMGVGGETLDVTDDLPEWLNIIAVDVCEIAQLPVGGVDFLLERSPSVKATKDQLNPMLIEINKCPALFMHELPTHGKARHVIRDYVNYLEKI